ncbi:MAG: [FeFe] hydrogenase H-cluster maturation GTPase HydF [Clostridia bacterium]|nr:[FeFe] hydrogenase H-cluster maturation GTPase HydF [Clostridia bacterium]
MADLNQTPRGERVHIGFFGRTNAGKSSLVNLLTGAETALVSPVAGTTTDPVFKSMELLPIGPVVLIDTAGTGDNTELSEARAKKTREAAARTDIAVFVRTDDSEDAEADALRTLFRQRQVPVIEVWNSVEGSQPASDRRVDVEVDLGNCSGGEGLRRALAEAWSGNEEAAATSGLVEAGDLVLLVMPQDIQAPKGRLILPQVQMIRELLDAGCRVLCIKTEDLPDALSDLRKPPALVITDSQAFPEVDAHLPNEIPLTSFSILLSKKKGDIEAFLAGAETIAQLKPGDRVLIAESCTHHALQGDIAREKLPKLLEKRAGGSLDIQVCSGPNFPDDVSTYKLILQCGGCMSNRRGMLSRLEAAREAGVPMTNFGTALAWLAGITPRICW